MNGWMKEGKFIVRKSITVISRQSFRGSVDVYIFQVDQVEYMYRSDYIFRQVLATAEQRW